MRLTVAPGKTRCPLSQLLESRHPRTPRLQVRVELGLRVRLRVLITKELAEGAVSEATVFIWWHGPADLPSIEHSIVTGVGAGAGVGVGAGARVGVRAGARAPAGNATTKETASQTEGCP